MQRLRYRNYCDPEGKKYAVARMSRWNYGAGEGPEGEKKSSGLLQVMS